MRSHLDTCILFCSPTFQPNSCPGNCVKRLKNSLYLGCDTKAQYELVNFLSVKCLYNISIAAMTNYQNFSGFSQLVSALLLICKLEIIKLSCWAGYLFSRNPGENLSLPFQLLEAAGMLWLVAPSSHQNQQCSIFISLSLCPSHSPLLVSASVLL